MRQAQHSVPLSIVVASSLALMTLALVAFYFLSSAPIAAVKAAQQSACIGGCHEQ